MDHVSRSLVVVLAVALPAVAFAVLAAPRATGRGGEVDRLERELAARAAEIDALRRRIDELQRAATPGPGGTRLVAEAPSADSAAAPEPPAETAQRPQQGTAPEEAALALLRALWPQRDPPWSLEELRAVETLDLRGTAVTDADLAHLAALPRLTSLGLRGTAVTDAGLRHLTGLAMLESLGLRGTAVTAVGLPSLPAGLRHLDLTDTKVSGSVHALAALPRVETLKLNRAPVDGHALAIVARMPSLRHLEIDGIPIEEDGLRRLVGDVPGLQRLEMRGTGASADLVSDLLRIRPDLSIAFEELALHPSSHRSRR